MSAAGPVLRWYGGVSRKCCMVDQKALGSGTYWFWKLTNCSISFEVSKANSWFVLSGLLFHEWGRNRKKKNSWKKWKIQSTLMREGLRN